MSSRVENDAFSARIDERDERWSAGLVKAAWAVLAVGIVVGGILWVAVDGATGEDLGALAWVISFTAAIAVMSIRQMILAERQ